MTDRLAAAMGELVEALRESVRAEAEAATRAPDRLLGIEETAATLGIGRTMVYDLIGRGTLRSIRAGRRRLVPAGAIADYIAAAGR